MFKYSYDGVLLVYKYIYLLLCFFLHTIKTLINYDQNIRLVVSTIFVAFNTCRNVEMHSKWLQVTTSNLFLLKKASHTSYICCVVVVFTNIPETKENALTLNNN